MVRFRASRSVNQHGSYSALGSDLLAQQAHTLARRGIDSKEPSLRATFVKLFATRFTSLLIPAGDGHERARHSQGLSKRSAEDFRSSKSLSAVRCECFDVGRDKTGS
jgi:hypothetical protein